MPRSTHALAAFLLAPPIAVAVNLITEAGFVLLEEGGDAAIGEFFRFPFSFTAGTIIAYLFAAIFGLPSYFLLKLLGIESLFITVSAAALIGSLFYVLPELGDRNPTFNFYGNGCHIIVDGARTVCGWWVFARGTLMSAYTGAIAGIAFWVVYTRAWKLGAKTSPTAAPFQTPSQNFRDPPG